MPVKLKLETVLERIKEKCKERNYEFLGFCDKEGNETSYIGNKDTFLKLKCNICDNIWKSTNYYNFIIRNAKCPECKKKKMRDACRLSEEEAISNILKKCKIKNYNFIGFCDDNKKPCHYKNSDTYLILHCNICNNTWNSCTYSTFVHTNCGCPECKKKIIGKLNSSNKEEFIYKSKQIYGDEFDYSKVIYKGNHTNVDIICKKHGVFSTTPSIHFRGGGCPFCRESKLEIKTKMLLDNNKITCERQKKFEWLGLMSVDFYLPQYNIAIECQGIQHFEEHDFTGHNPMQAKLNFILQKERDIKKFNLCKENGIQLLYFTNIKFDKSNPCFEGIYTEENTFYDLDELLTKITYDKSYDNIQQKEEQK